MVNFITQRDRDAWSTIRGYVYQVHLTIARWLDLQPGQLLELECGEDIDLLSQVLASEAKEERLLEQVKHRESISLTLRTPEALTAVANYFEHCRANPEIALIFRYTTNAKIGQERPSPLPNGAPALSAWEQIRQGSLPAPELPRIAEGLRTLLSNSTRPATIREELWTQFQDFLREASLDAFLSFIQTFEWSTGVADVSDLRSYLQQCLIEKHYASDHTQAQEQYQHLFFYIFQLLSQRGVKRLTLEDRKRQLSRPLLSEKDQALCNLIIGRVSSLETRVSTLEQGYTDLRTQQTHEFTAQLRLSEARQALESGNRAKFKERMEQALDLWSALPGVRRDLALELSKDVAANFRGGHKRGDYLMTTMKNFGRKASKNEPATSEAVFWLEGAKAYGEDHDGAVSAALALMYGVYGPPNGFNKMMQAIAQACQINPNWKGYFQDPEQLLMLIHTCGNNLDAIQETGAKLDMLLPAPESTVCATIRQMNLASPYDQYTDWYVMGQPAVWLDKPVTSTPGFPIWIRFMGTDETGERTAKALYYLPDHPEVVRLPANGISHQQLEKLVAELSSLFVFITCASQRR